jgi:hypothetical protein
MLFIVPSDQRSRFGTTGVLKEGFDVFQIHLENTTSSQPQKCISISVDVAHMLVEFLGTSSRTTGLTSIQANQLAQSFLEAVKELK